MPKTKIHQLITFNSQTKPKQYYRKETCVNPVPTQEVITTKDICHITRSANTNVQRSYNTSYSEYLRKRACGGVTKNIGANSSSSRVDSLKYNTITGGGSSCENCSPYRGDKTVEKDIKVGGSCKC